AVEAEGARAGVELLAARADHEEAVPLDPQVGATAGRLGAALREVRRDRAEPHPEADLRRVHATGVRAGRAGRLHEFAERVAEGRLAGFEADGVDVGDVVAGHVQHLLVDAETADAGVERTEHRYSFAVGRATRSLKTPGPSELVRRR